jgi:hypothetical protein
MTVSSKQNLYTGRSGQLAVMAEFLRRGYNAASPEVDVGEDLFVIRDADGKLWRVQVKAALGKGKRVVSGTFKIPLAQLGREHRPELFYVFALHHKGLWREFVIVRRDALEAMRGLHGVGHEVESHLILRLAFTAGDVRCSDMSFQPGRGDWSKWPVIPH